jgi:hypothetical protein
VRSGARFVVQHSRISNADESGVGTHLESGVFVAATEAVRDPLTSAVCPHRRNLSQTTLCQVCCYSNNTVAFWISP